MKVAKMVIDNDDMDVYNEQDEPYSPEDCSEPSIPDKSRSLRARSVQKRFQTELKQKGRRKKKEKISKAARMTKYRRKAANAKERERMKKVNEAFDRLRGVMPDLNLILQDEKDTKVTTLRAAITYIYGLQNLLEDIHAGSIDPIKYNKQELTPTTPKKTPKPTKSRSRATTGGQSRTKSVKISPVTLGIKGNNLGSANSKKGSKMSTSLPLQPRDAAKIIDSNQLIENGTKFIGGNQLIENGGKIVSGNQLITLHNDNSTLTAQVLQTFRLTPSSNPNLQSTPNLLFLEPIPASQLQHQTTPLPSMQTLRKPTTPISNNSVSSTLQASKDYYVVLNSTPISSNASTTTTSVSRVVPMVSVPNIITNTSSQPDCWLSSRPRRDSGSSTGFNLRSPSSSPNSSMSMSDFDYDSSVLDSSMECVISMVNVNMDSTTTMTSATTNLPYEVMKCSTNGDKNLAEDIPESPTTLEPSIGQLFKRQQTYQQVESMDQYVILDDIHQIIEENSSLLL